MTFIHRAGRTGRIGNKGLCISLVSQYDVEVLNGIEEDLNADFIKSMRENYNINNLNIILYYAYL